MTTTLEFQSQPCHAAALWVTVTSNGKLVPQGATVTVCAWHEGAKQLTEHLTKIGYQVSHGICRDCKTKWEQDMMRSQLK